MTGDFYCDEVLSGRTQVNRIAETDRILAFHHTRPSYPVHIVIIPKWHIESLIDLDLNDHDLITELFGIIRQIASQILSEHGACRVITNLGEYQDSKHLHFHVVSGDIIR